MQFFYTLKKKLEGLPGYRPNITGIEGMISAAIQKQIITKEEADMIREADMALSAVIHMDNLSADIT